MYKILMKQKEIFNKNKQSHRGEAQVKNSNRNWIMDNKDNNKQRNMYNITVNVYDYNMTTNN